MNSNNEEKKTRLSQAARKLNVGTDTIAAFLTKKGFSIENKPNAKITTEQFDLLAVEFVSAGVDKQEAAHVTIGKHYKELAADKGEALGLERKERIGLKKKLKFTEGDIKAKNASPTHYTTHAPILPGLKKVGKVTWPRKEVNTQDGDAALKEPAVAAREPYDTKKAIDGLVGTSPTESAATDKDKISFSHPSDLKAPTVVGKITFSQRATRKQVAHPVTHTQERIRSSAMEGRAIPPYGKPAKKADVSSLSAASRIAKGGKVKTKQVIEGVSAQGIENQIKKTLAKLHQGSGDSFRAKYKRDKRIALLEAKDKRQRQQQEAVKVLRITAFISVNELASFMGVMVNEVLASCMSLGIIVSINQRLDAETITIVADEFGYRVEFVDVQEEKEEGVDEEEEGAWVERSPIVTIMGHVDHGKTSLLDYIRTTKVAAKEVGGITQHIGAYDIVTADNKRIVFLDTPGHEAFTAMRTRGASVTDIIVIVVAADDSVMPQTRESISHAQVAGCSIIIAINKMDKPQANAEKVKEDLASLNILVEDWGGRYQCQELSAKTGKGVNELLDKILLEASLLELKAMPAKKAKGTVIESFLDPGRGYVVTAIVQDGTLRVGDIVLAGTYYGKVKAMLNHQGVACTTVPPATPVQVLGLNGAPRAGDTFRVMDSMKEVVALAQKRQQLLREQTLRTKGQLTLDEIGRRLAIGNFKELNIIIKGDVDGSIEALADALLRLSHEEVQVNIVHKCVGSVSESDILLATATDAMIIAFHIKPSAQAKKLAEKEGIEIKHYAVIYSVLDDVRRVVEGLLSPTIEEVPTGRAEIKKIFAIAKVGNIAGCQVQTGIIKQSNQIRVIRKNEVVFTGFIHTIKHGAEELKQAKAASECGIHIKDFNNIEIGDIIEGFERKEVKRKV